jgi:saccharopine dehydrogenase (NAD+, L-lysine-forming)
VDYAHDADVLLGIKEVPVSELIPQKTYLFFSHTIKKQPYNQKLLQSVLEKQIELIDYECLSWPKGDRILGFGRWAGVVGAYNAMLVWGEKYGHFKLKAAHACADYGELQHELTKVNLPAIKIGLTGKGRVGKGALELLGHMGIPEVSPTELLNQSFNEAVFANLDNEDLYQRKDGKQWEKSDFYNNHSNYEGIFRPYMSELDMLINGMYWEESMEPLFSKEDTAKADFKIRVIADITCDVEGSVPITMKATPINDPVFGWDRSVQKVCPPYMADTIDVMAVTNLPAELPSSASEEFGESMMEHILPLLIEGDQQDILKRAAITNKQGNLNELYLYLGDYAFGE